MQRQLRGQANLGLVLQVLRRDVSSRPPTGTPPSSGEKRTAHALILTDKGPDVMVCPRERPNVAKNMLLDHPHLARCCSTQSHHQRAVLLETLRDRAEDLGGGIYFRRVGFLRCVLRDVQDGEFPT